MIEGVVRVYREKETETEIKVDSASDRMRIRRVREKEYLVKKICSPSSRATQSTLPNAILTLKERE